MIKAHGARVDVRPHSVAITYSPLLQALGHDSREIPLSEISGVRIQEPTPSVDGWVLLEGPQIIITVSAGHAQSAQELAASISAALGGDADLSTLSKDASASAGVGGMNFVAFDVETANSDWGSICQIGAVRYVDGVATDSVSWLVTPPPGLDTFEPANVAIHGITAADVATAAPFADRLPDFLAFVGDNPLIAHNAQFDFTALLRACEAARIEAPRLLFGCSLLFARAAQLGFENNKLPTVAAGLGVDLTRHHDAVSDAAACGDIAVALARRSGFSGDFLEFCFSQGFTLGILEPGRVYPVLRDRSGAGIALQRKKFGRATGVGASPVAPTPTPTPERRSRQSPAPWSRVATPDEIPNPNPDADPAGELFGQSVTLTGDFAPYEKGDLWQQIADQGAQIGKNVTKKTTILVCGPWASKTSKQKRAEELQEKGQEIAIWDEQRLYGVLGLNEEPPF